jgi:fatty-acyl-CoA synthase
MKIMHTDRLCIPVPMYHCFGMVLGTLLCATRGATMVFPSAGFDAGAVLDVVEAERCTVLHGVPTMFIAELDQPDFSTPDLSSLRTGIMAGAPCPVELMHRVMKDMHMSEITIAYGMTETGPPSTQTSTDDPVDSASAPWDACCRTRRSRSSTPTGTSSRPARPASFARGAIA